MGSSWKWVGPEMARPLAEFKGGAGAEPANLGEAADTVEATWADG
jgi:hypothetical protein